MKCPSYLSQTQTSLAEQTEMAGVLDALYLDRILKPQRSGGDTNLRERSAKFKLGAFYWQSCRTLWSYLVLIREDEPDEC